MTLTKDGFTMTTEDKTVIRAYTQNGWVESKEVKEEKPKKATKKSTK